MKSIINWGILGPGRIATKFATDLVNLPEANLLAVGSRSKARANKFAQTFGIARSYGNYDKLVTDPDVDVIYVATPHTFHKEHTLLCLQNNKAVLCEKPMAMNEGQLREMVELARKKNLFLMEGMWTRFLPVIQQVKDWLRKKTIGDVRILSSDFGFRTGWNPQDRLLNPNLAGGALLDVGVYTVALTYMVYGDSPRQVIADAYIGETGVDEQTAMLLRYDDGALALLFCSIRTNTPQEARILGTLGSIHIPGFWHTTSAVLQIEGKDPVKNSGEAGYHFEAAEVMSCLKAGKNESSRMPLDESLAIVQTMDHVRALIGLTYPMEKKVDYTC
jgi:predicted dehydrogenase